jgi:hypothetical protein
MKAINCSDWGDGWGFGGSDRIGKLYKTDVPNQYKWVGIRQGRHGQSIMGKRTVLFTYEDGAIHFDVTNKINVLPAHDHVLTAIETLNKPQPTTKIIWKQQRKLKTPSNQISLTI